MDCQVCKTVWCNCVYCFALRAERKFAQRPPFMLNSRTFTRRGTPKAKMDIAEAFKAAPIQ